MARTTGTTAWIDLNSKSLREAQDFYSANGPDETAS